MKTWFLPPSDEFVDACRAVPLERPVTPAVHYSERVVLDPAAYAALGDSGLAAEMRAYLERHARPGAFLFALLSNDLRAAAERSTGFTAHRLPALIAWLVANAPPAAWGSDLAVRTWLAPQVVHALQLDRVS